MTEFQEILDFPPAPKLLFFGKARCSECHAAPFYTDDLMHNLQAERFYKPQIINGLMAPRTGLPG